MNTYSTSQYQRYTPAQLTVLALDALRTAQDAEAASALGMAKYVGRAARGWALLACRREHELQQTVVQA